MLSTIGFAATFWAWALLSPLGATLSEQLSLSSFQQSLLVAVPVVDDQNRLHGIVTADDALDKIIPTAWKKRLPRLYH